MTNNTCEIKEYEKPSFSKTSRAILSVRNISHIKRLVLNCDIFKVGDYVDVFQKPNSIKVTRAGIDSKNPVKVNAGLIIPIRVNDYPTGTYEIDIIDEETIEVLIS